jgi:hypothetical protein
VSTSGWYNDESDPTLARWFDGVGWTEHVTSKAQWEAAGHGPPPPEELLAPVGPPRLRMVVATAAVLGVLVVGGVALARDGGGDGSGRAPTAGEPGAAKVAGSTVVDGPGGVGADATAPTDGVGSSGSTADHAGATGRTTDRGGTSRTTERATSAVQRTDTETHTHTDPGPVAEASKGDKTSVGNTTDTTITIGYVPPPPTTATSEPPTTVADTTPTEETTTTAP